MAAHPTACWPTDEAMARQLATGGKDAAAAAIYAEPAHHAPDAFKHDAAFDFAKAVIDEALDDAIAQWDKVNRLVPDMLATIGPAVARTEAKLDVVLTDNTDIKAMLAQLLARSPKTQAAIRQVVNPGVIPG